MRIGIDLRFTAASQMGTGSYAETMTLALADAVGDEHTLVGFGEADGLVGRLADVIEYVRIEGAAAGRDPVAATRLLWDSAVDRAGLDVYFAPTGLAPLVKTCPVVITIHDLLFEHHPEHFAPELLAYLKREIARSVRAADAIVAVSEFTKREVIETYGVPEEKVTVVHQPLRDAFRERPPDDTVATVLKRLGVETPYLLTLSNHAPHKNTRFALEVFARWLEESGDKDHTFVVAGGGPAPHPPVDPARVAAEVGIADRVQILGRVDDADLPSLYAGAKVFLFPSLYEGWGLPPLEAMAMGTSAIVSDRGALPEAVGDAATVLPVESVDDWACVLGAPPETAVDAFVAGERCRTPASAGGGLATLLRSIAAPSAPTPEARSIAVGPREQMGTPTSRIVDQVGAQSYVLDASWGLGDRLLLTSVAATIKRHCPDTRIWLRSWLDGLPLPSCVEQGTPPPDAVQIALGYGMPADLRRSSTFPGSLRSRMLEDFNRKAGKEIPIPRQMPPLRTGLPIRTQRDAGTVALMAHGTGANPAKEWGRDKFCQLASILTGMGWRVMQVGSEDDAGIPGTVDNRSSSLVQAAETMSTVEIFVGQVGFLMHLASATQTPAVIVYGGREHPDISGADGHLKVVPPAAPCMGQWGCWLDNHVTCPVGHACMSVISPEFVANLIGRPPLGDFHPGTIVCRGEREGPQGSEIVRESDNTSATVPRLDCDLDGAFWEEWEKIEGWLGRDEARLLYCAARDARGEFVEIGAYCGRSTAVLAAGRKAADKPPVISIDHGKGSPEHEGQDAVADTWVHAEANLRGLSLWENVSPIKSSSVEASTLGVPDVLGGLFIDGSHSYAEVARDLRLWAPRLVPGGLLLLHDYVGTWEGVKRAADEVASDCGLEYRGCHWSTAIFQRSNCLPLGGPDQVVSASGHPAGQRHSLSGCMIIRNGVKLGYPFVEAVLCVIDHVDEMVIVDGESEDGTWEWLEQMAETCDKIKLSRSPWPTTRTGGRAIAEATNDALRRCKGTHILYVQADEIYPRRLLDGIRDRIAEGYDAAAVPFIHLRTSWWKVIVNPAYQATVRVIPNRPDVFSHGDGATFGGPLGRVAPPHIFSDHVYHVGWVYPANTIEKHRNHAELYQDSRAYADKAARASELNVDSAAADDLGMVDGEYRLQWFTEKHPSAIQHLVWLRAYDPAPGMRIFRRRTGGGALGSPQCAGKVTQEHVPE